MRWVLGLALSVSGIALACAGDGGEPITAEPVRVDISSFSAHDPSNSLITVAVKFEPALSPQDEPTLAVLDRPTGDVIATLSVDRAVERTVCSGIERFPGWEIFSIRGEAAEMLQLSPDQHELRAIIERDGRQKEFSLDIPPQTCFAIE